MSEHAGLRGRIEAAGRNEFFAGINRMSGLLASAILLPVISALGFIVWGDIKDGQRVNAEGQVKLADKIDAISAELRGKIDAIAGDVSKIQVNQAVTETKLQAIDDLLDRRDAGAPPVKRGRAP